MSGQHARLSPSGSHRWLSCPGSIVLESAFPNESNEFSDNGTAMHEVASGCLLRSEFASAFVGDLIIVSDPSEPLRDITFTTEMAETVQGYVDTVLALAEGHELHVEKRVEFSDFVGVPDQFGTADAIILRGDEMCVIDLKTGFRFVEVENNTQLMLYALGAYGLFELTHSPTTARLMIYQPQHGGMREWVVSIDDLLVFAQTARYAAGLVEMASRSKESHVLDPAEWAEVYLNPDPNDSDCAFCRAMSTCPAKRAKLERVVGLSFDVIDETIKPDHDALRYSTDDYLSTAMKAADELEDFIKAVRAEVERRLLLGQEVPGFGLELGREGARSWQDADAAVKYMRETMRLPIETCFDMKPISPTTAEKLANFKQGKPIAKPKTKAVIGKRQWASLQQMIVRSKPVPSVKPLSAIKTPYTPLSPDAGAFDDVTNEDLL
jgi:Protein of unknown function (DUF2800)